MPQLRTDNVLNEFEFTAQELIAARTLSPLQVQWFQTKYAQLFKQKASSLIPADSGLDRDFLLTLGEVEGKLNMLQEIFADHAAVLAELADPDKVGAVTEINGQPIVDSTASRASNLVDSQN